MNKLHINECFPYFLKQIPVQILAMAFKAVNHSKIAVINLRLKELKGLQKSSDSFTNFI